MSKNNEYRFLFSELKYSDKEISYIVELMRVGEHIISFTNYFDMAQLWDTDGEASIKNMMNIDVFVLNVMGAQLKEAMSLFSQFIKNDLHKKFKENLKDSSLKNLIYLENISKEFDNGEGILLNILLPHRNKVYHYDCKKAEQWVKEEKKMENPKIPFIQIIKPNSFSFPIGLQYDKYIYTRAFFSSPTSQEGVTPGQNEIIVVQNALLNYINRLSEFIVDDNQLKLNKYQNSFQGFF